MKLIYVICQAKNAAPDRQGISPPSLSYLTDPKRPIFKWTFLNLPKFYTPLRGKYIYSNLYYKT